MTLRKQYRLIPRQDPMDPQFRRLSYVRYADNFLISVIGPRYEAVQIMKQVGSFLRSLGLTMNLAKIKLTHARMHKAHFLGTYIGWNASPNKPVILRRRSRTQSRKKVRVQPRIQFKAPIDLLVQKLVKRGLCKWDPAGHFVKPTRLTRMVNMDHADIVRYYNAMVNG